jgi:hypothetical protein
MLAILWTGDDGQCRSRSPSSSSPRGGIDCQKARISGGQNPMQAAQRR